MTEPAGPEVDAGPPHAPQCPWCAATVTEEATHCPACGAAIAQRESIGGLKIAGLTAVDPALEDFDKRPLHLRGPSATQGVAPAPIIGAVAGGPIGLMAIGGVAAVAAAELMGAKQAGAGGQNLADLGRPSDLLIQALEHADDATSTASAATAAAADTGSNPSGTAAEPEARPPDRAAEDGGRSVWRDLPEPHDESSDEAR